VNVLEVEAVGDNSDSDIKLFTQSPKRRRRPIDRPHVSEEVAAHRKPMEALAFFVLNAPVLNAPLFHTEGHFLRECILILTQPLRHNRSYIHTKVSDDSVEINAQHKILIAHEPPS